MMSDAGAEHCGSREDAREFGLEAPDQRVLGYPGGGNPSRCADRAISRSESSRAAGFTGEGKRDVREAVVRSEPGLLNFRPPPGTR